jgi:hypothetical protein
MERSAAQGYSPPEVLYGPDNGAIFYATRQTDNRRKPVDVRFGEFMACAGMARPELLAGLVQSRHPN